MHRLPPRLMNRRAVLAGGLMLPGTAMAARIAPADAEVNAAAIHWPAGATRELHGYMAIPAGARGRQPAVLVIGGRDTPDTVQRALVRATAQAGFVACTANGASILDETLADDMRATAGWLANGRYGTGRVGAIGLGAGTPAAIALAGDRTVTAAVAFDAPAVPAGGAPVLLFRQTGAGSWSALPGTASSAGPAEDWARAWTHAMAYLREHLT